MRVVSEESGLGRSSLYHYFPGGKEEMAIAALDAAARLIDSANEALRTSGQPRKRLRAMLDILAEYYEDGALGCLIGTFATADCPPTVRSHVVALVQSWIGSIAEFLAEAGVPDADAEAARSMVKLQGSLMLTGLTGDATHFRSALTELSALLPEQHPSGHDHAKHIEKRG